jgi:hypothetical protein
MDLLPRWFQDGYTVHSSQYTGVGRWGEKLRLCFEYEKNKYDYMQSPTIHAILFICYIVCRYVYLLLSLLLYFYYCCC